MKRKVLSLMLLLSLTATSIVGCGNSSAPDSADVAQGVQSESTAESGGDNSAAGGEEIVLTFPTYWCGENVGGVYFEPAVERFNSENAGKYKVVIEEVVEDTFNDKLSQLAQTKKLPALIGGASADFVNQVLIQNNLYAPMNEFLEENPDIAQLCIDSSVDYCTQDNGDIVSVPIVSLANMGTFYNTDLYKPEKHISEMTTDEFVSSLGSNKMAFQTVDNAWTSMLFLTSLIANEDGGAEWLIENDGSKVTDFNKPFVVDAIKTLGEVWKTNASDNAIGAAYADAANAFTSNQAAVICNGSWMNSTFKEAGKENWSGDFNGASVKADYYPGNIAICNTKGYGRYLMTNCGTPEEQECAKAFLKFIYSQPELEQFALCEGNQIPNMEYSQDFLDKLSADPIASDQTTLVTEATTIVPSFSSIMYDSVANDVFANDLVQFVNGAITAEDFANDLTKKSTEAAE